jgi:transcriptional regulator with XRE-family HTH domain
MNVSLGGLIKTYRMNRRLSQFDVASAIGWKDTSRLSKIEQGRVKPTRQVVEKIMDALNLDEVERGEFLHAGDYIPTENDIKRVRKVVQPFLDRWPYPALLDDFTWRLIAFNKKGLKLYGINENWAFQIRKTKPNLFELIFNPEIAKGLIIRGKDNSYWYEWAKENIGQFKIEHHYHSNEPWFQQLMKKLMPLPHFREMWNEVRSHTFKGLIHRYSHFTILAEQFKEESRLSFNAFILPYFRDRRFDLTLFVPVDNETWKFYQGRERFIPPKLVSHIALFTNVPTESVREFLISHLLAKIGDEEKIYFFRYIMNKPGRKEDLYRALGSSRTRFHIRDWSDVQVGSYENGKFVIKKILTQFRKDLEDSKMLEEIDQIDNVSEVSGYTLQRDREGMLFWEKNMGKIFSEIFPENHFRFGFICVYPLSQLKNLADFKQIVKLHDNVWYLIKDDVLKVGDDAISALKKNFTD